MSREERSPPQQQQHPLLGKRDLDMQDSETSVFDSVEGRPAGDMADLSKYAFSALSWGGDVPQETVSGRKTPTLKDLARRVGLMKAASQKNFAYNRHKRNPSRAVDLLESISLDSEKHQLALNARRQSVDETMLFKHVDSATTHLSETESVVEVASSDGEDSDHTEGRPHIPSWERLPFHHGTSLGYGAVADRLSATPPIQSGKFGWRRRSKTCFKHCTPDVLWELFERKILRSCFVLLAMPLLGAALIFYYYLGNPEFDFLPGKVTLSWWCNFAGRQVITLELARMSQWFLIDTLMLGTRFALRLFGPLITLFAIQAKGWPFVIATWALWDLCLIHGDNRFQVHWFYWTGWKIYSEGNSGSHLLRSDIYLRFLLCVLLAGAATAGKRFAVAVRLGTRQFSEFKPRLEKILSEVVLLNEIAALGQQATEMEEEMLSEINIAKAKTPSRGLSDVKWSSVKFVNDDSGHSDSEDDAADLEKLAENPFSKGYLARTDSGSFRIKDLLDRWEEPMNKLDKSNEVTIRDILKFKRALTYMDEDHPFGEDFGPADTRDECLVSAHNVYFNLLRLSNSKNGVLPFEILELLAVDDRGNTDANKKKALQKMFRPDLGNKETLLAFVQTCDSTYKRLRYFRASVGNASVIDKVLEDIIDGVFYFVLALFLLSMMNYNPWTLLVSITSLLVSISFALGPSVSRYVEGVLLIAVRRPFDLGDRIFIAGPESVMAGDVSGNTWFVEDINLTTTTLRYARTNEVSSVNNWSIAGSRIVNCNRSPNAIVFYEMKMHIAILDGENLAKFNSKLEQYVTDHPRIWDSLAFCRHESIDADYEIVYFVIAFRHRNSWQDAARIKLNRAELLRYMHDVGKKLGVNLETPPARRLLYYGGVLENGQVEDYKKNLLNPKNIISHKHGDDATVAPPAQRSSRDFKEIFQRSDLDPHGGILQGE